MAAFTLSGYIFAKSGLINKVEFESTADKIIAATGSILIIHIALAVHELGHLLVGLWLGFRFEMYVIGLLGVKREDGKVKFYLNKNISFYGGIAATSPTNDSKDNPNKFAKILLAGPIASLIFALICLIISVVSDPILEFIFFIGSLSSFGIFLATTLPSKTGMFFTDRKRYQRLIQPGKDREIEIAMLNIMGTLARDNSYKNIDYKNIKLLISDDTSFFRFFGLFNAICYQMEINGKVEDDVMSMYKSTSRDISKNLVVAFDKEIEKNMERISTEPNNSLSKDAS